MQKDKVEFRWADAGESATLNAQRPLVCTVCFAPIHEGERVHINIKTHVTRHEPRCASKTLTAFA